MLGADKGTAPRLDGSDLRVAIVQARFNAAITDALAEHCVNELVLLGVQRKHIRHVSVPGALEVAVALQALADSDDHDALIAEVGTRLGTALADFLTCRIGGDEFAVLIPDCQGPARMRSFASPPSASARITDDAMLSASGDAQTKPVSPSRRCRCRSLVRLAITGVPEAKLSTNLVGNPALDWRRSSRTSTVKSAPPTSCPTAACGSMPCACNHGMPEHESSPSSAATWPGSGPATSRRKDAPASARRATA